MDDGSALGSCRLRHLERQGKREVVSAAWVVKKRRCGGLLTSALSTVEIDESKLSLLGREIRASNLHAISHPFSSLGPTQRSLITPLLLPAQVVSFPADAIRELTIYRSLHASWRSLQGKMSEWKRV